MKQLIFFICALFGCINTAKAQVTISTSDLKGTKWQTADQYNKQSKSYYEYTQDAEIRHEDDGNTIESPYYLTDTVPSKFDYARVGKSTKGCYLIAINTKLDILYCFSIRSFDKTDGTMVLQSWDANLHMGDALPGLYILIPSNKPRNQYVNPPISDNW